jgi:hypothetical protein
MSDLKYQNTISDIIKKDKQLTFRFRLTDTVTNRLPKPKVTPITFTKLGHSWGGHDTQHNNIQHNDTRHKRLLCDAKHIRHIKHTT